jgi:hypothetical protein
VSQSIAKFAEFDPAKFAQNPEAASNNQDETKGKDILIKQSNVANNIVSVVEAVSREETVKNSTLNVETFVKAFDDFIVQIKSDDKCGIPCGLNTSTFTGHEIAIECTELIKKQQAEETKTE